MNTELNIKSEQILEATCEPCAPSDGDYEPIPFDPEKCTYISYARSEFELAKITDSELIELTRAALIEIGKEGHSGGSMGWFSSVFLKWSEDPAEPKTDSLLFPIWNIIKDVSPEKRQSILYYIFRTMTFKPLSPLTGDDEEWIALDYGDGTKKQNKRHSSVFMRDDGTCYDIDGIVHCHPYVTYTGWHGVTGQFSLVDVSFPYEVPNRPIYKYFEDEEWKKPIPTDTKDDWLDMARHRFLRGVLPDGRIDERVWIGSLNDCQETLYVFNQVKDLPFWDDKYKPDSLFSDAFYLCPRDERLISEGNRYVFAIEGYEPKVTQKTVMMLVRLMTDYKGTGFSYRITTAQRPDKNCQGWVDSGYAIVPEKISGTFFVTETQCMTNDVLPNSMLYTECKRKGLEYKGLKKGPPLFSKTWK